MASGPNTSASDQCIPKVGRQDSRASRGLGSGVSQIWVQISAHCGSWGHSLNCFELIHKMKKNNFENIKIKNLFNGKFVQKKAPQTNGSQCGP